MQKHRMLLLDKWMWRGLQRWLSREEHWLLQGIWVWFPEPKVGWGWGKGCAHTQKHIKYVFSVTWWHTPLMQYLERRRMWAERSWVYGYSEPHSVTDPISQNIPKYSNKEVCRYCQSLYFYCLSTMHETRFICEQDIDKHMFVYSCGSVKIFSVVK